MVEMDRTKAWFWRRLALGSSGHMLWDAEEFLSSGHLDRCLMDEKFWMGADPVGSV
jgi:hypothetical protein